MVKLVFWNKYYSKVNTFSNRPLTKLNKFFDKSCGTGFHLPPENFIIKFKMSDWLLNFLKQRYLIIFKFLTLWQFMNTYLAYKFTISNHPLPKCFFVKLSVWHFVHLASCPGHLCGYKIVLLSTHLSLYPLVCLTICPITCSSFYQNVHFVC